MSDFPGTAFVLGAGLGTRLKTLTQRLPKPLVPVCNTPLIERAFSHLHQAGVSRFVINTHWQANAYTEAFPSHTWNGLPLHFSHESPEILETAGGLKLAEPLLPTQDPFWVYNGDILSTLPLREAWTEHQRANNEVTLVLRSKDGPLQVSFDSSTKKILDLGRRVSPNLEPQFLFTGIYIVEPAFLQRIPAGVKLGVVPVFIEMIRSGARLGGVVVDSGDWWDLGSREQILAVHQSMKHNGAPWIHPSARVDPSAKLSGATAIGAGVSIGAHSILKDTLVWKGSTISPHSELQSCIVTADRLIEGKHSDADL